MDQPVPRGRRGGGQAPLYLALFVVLGLATSLVGPSIALLRDQVHVGTGAIGAVFAFQGGGYLIGTAVFGRRFDRGSGHRLLAAVLVLMAVGMLALAGPSGLLGLGVVFVAIGLACGVIDVGGNSLLSWAASEHSAPWMVALHLCFGVGAVLSPLAVALSDHVGGDVRLAATIVAALAIVVAVWSLLVPTPVRPIEVPERSGADSAAVRGPGVASVAVFLFLYVGVEVGFGGWIHTYAGDVGMGSGAATAVTTAFWASFTLGRLCSVAVARRRSARQMLGVASGAMTTGFAALVVLSLASGNPAAVVVWGCTLLVGFSAAPQFPMILAYAGERQRLSAGTMAAIVTTAGVGGLTMPWLIGAILDRAGAKAMPVALLVMAAATQAWWRFVVAPAHSRVPRSGSSSEASPAR